MKLLTSFDERISETGPLVFTFGTFDGVHLGHKHIFELVQKEGKTSAALTFSNHPIEILQPSKPALQLTSSAQKIALLTPFFDYLLTIPFTKELQALSARDFLQKVRRVIPFTHIVVGSDVSFGKNREGNRESLLSFGKELGFTCSFSERIVPISSSAIRTLIQEAKFRDAAKFLGRPYSHYLPVRDGVVDLFGYVTPPNGTYRAKIELKKDEGWKETIVYLKGNKLSIGLELHVQDQFIEIEYIDGPL